MFLRFFPLAAMLVSSISAVTRLGEWSLPRGAGEIVAVDPARKLLVVTRDGRWRKGLEFVDLSDPRHPKSRGHLSLKRQVSGGLASVSSVAIDPSGRGFAAVALVPKNPIRQRGLVALVNLDTRKVIARAQTGYHPDCVAFSPDGKFLAVACEGEWQDGQRNTPGSLSVHRFGPDRPFRFIDVPLDRSGGLRLPRGKVEDLEPEYLTIKGSRAYVTLQENNGLGIFDLSRLRWERVRSFGRWSVRLDPSDRDGPGGTRRVNPTAPVLAYPMPDSLASFRWRGRIYLATANEGEGAGAVRAKKLGQAGLPALDPNYRRILTQRFGGDPLDEARLGRLQILPDVGDTDRDGDLDELIATGTRSFSIWDAATGKRIYDSGSFFAKVGQANPGLFNVDDGDPAKWDTRSDNRGTEPEAIAAALIRGRPVLAVATERQNVVFFFDCRNPARPKVLTAINEMAAGHFAPESVLLLPASQSPTGMPFAVVGWEGSSSLTFYEL